MQTLRCLLLFTIVTLFSFAKGAELPATLDLRGKINGVNDLGTALTPYVNPGATPLKELNLSDNRGFGNAGLKFLITNYSSICENLDTLNLSNVGIDVQALPDLEAFINLRRLDLSHNPNLKVESVPIGVHVPLLMANLEVFIAKDIGKYRAFLTNIHQAFPRLRQLDFSVSHLDSTGDLLGSNLTDFPSMHLEELILDGHQNIRGGIDFIARIATLKRLSLNNCNLVDGDIRPLYFNSQLAFLTHIYLTRNHFTGTGIINLCCYVKDAQQLSFKDQHPPLPEETAAAFKNIFGSKIILEF
jgi:hypothetical protein